MTDPFPFDAVLFDLDGTLVATDRFWVRAARAGARRAFAELGLERELPDAGAWLSMVGLPLEQGFANVFPDLSSEQRHTLMEHCVAEEESALRAGGAALLPGALPVLQKLAELGVSTGIASNCGRGYLDHMRAALGLDRYIDESRCLDSTGISNKADMIADLLGVFDTRSAVMVGDRSTDARAAHANGVPHVHLADGLAPMDERVECEATIAGLDELLARLGRRTDWLWETWTGLGLGERPARPTCVAVIGAPAAGKSLWARDAARLLRARSVSAAVCTLDDPARAASVVSAVLAPHAGGAPVDAALLADSGGGEESVGAAGVLLLEGRAAADPLVQPYLSATIRLEASEPVRARRLLGRDGPARPRDGDGSWGPAGPDDRVLVADNALGPA